VTNGVVGDVLNYDVVVDYVFGCGSGQDIV